jgi:hypothetical protein
MHSGDSKGFVSRRRSSSYICIASSVGENSDFFFFSTSFLSGTVTIRPHTLSPCQGSLTELSDWIVRKGVLQNRCLHVHNLSRTSPFAAYCSDCTRSDAIISIRWTRPRLFARYVASALWILEKMQSPGWAWSRLRKPFLPKYSPMETHNWSATRLLVSLPLGSITLTSPNHDVGDHSLEDIIERASEAMKPLA